VSSHARYVVRVLPARRELRPQAEDEEISKVVGPERLKQREGEEYTCSYKSR
jgi:hypothetical protein